MQLVPYPKISPLNTSIMNRFSEHPQAKACDWVVTEFIDGDHLAMYADYKTKEFKLATRNKFIQSYMNYSCSAEIGELYKDSLLKLSDKEDSPIVVFGKLIGGHYANKTAEIFIKTVCEYGQFNDVIIHDIYIPKIGFIGLDVLEQLGETYTFRTAPILYHGEYVHCCGFPENSLSAVPFMVGEKPLFDNEMKGIVIRPVYDMFMRKDRMLMKKLNRRYIGKLDMKKKKPELTNTLTDIAAYMHNESMQLGVLNKIITEYGEFNYVEVKRVAGRYVANTIDKVPYIKYNMLDKLGKHLVHKELARIAEDKLREIVRLKNVA